ncbi:unnamed protein product, partial [Ectocarpus fasciculatus]
SFLLKVVSHSIDGSTSIVRSIPCAAGSSSEVCMVELAVVFNDAADEVGYPSDDDAESVILENPDEGSKEQDSRTLKTIHTPATSGGKESFQSRGSPDSRQLQSGNTQIDVLVVYTPEAYSYRGWSETQLLSDIATGVGPMNEATSNSDIALDFNLVHVEQLPYDQLSPFTTDYDPELDAMRNNAALAALRDLHEADLVLLVGYFPFTCGLGYLFNGNENFGFSLMDSVCFDNWTQTHEIGHNLGCDHDRDNADDDRETAYGHGLRYCTGTDQYRTVMTYAGGCDDAALVNYFSNPDVQHLGQPTGTATENNAQTVQDNMVAVSLFRPIICADGEPCASCLAIGTPASIGDGVCDTGNNNESCEYDGGDCCECECSEAQCNDDCTTPAWECEHDETRSTDPNIVLTYGVGCSAVQIADLGDCDYLGNFGEPQACNCFCREAD